MIPVKLGVGFVEGVQVLGLLLRDVAYARYVLFCEAQALWIHVPGVDEGLRLLRAPARIGFVDQAALVVQKRMEIAPGARELLPKVLAADLQELGADNV